MKAMSWKRLTTKITFKRISNNMSILSTIFRKKVFIINEMNVCNILQKLYYIFINYL